ncbi:MAG TPA: ABC transporter permease subunit [Burkholderiales bacterium]|nr:ABC transporter permease subunit [Burkholderiales bacterium]
MQLYAEMQKGGLRYLRTLSWWDLLAILLILAIVIVFGSTAHQMTAPFAISEQPRISLSPWALPAYTLRTTIRMLIGLAASLLFTLIYATLAAKSRRAELLLLPILDVLQSVPVLGYLSFTTILFISLFPYTWLGPELAAIFAIFTAQAWNMTFSFYQALKTIPDDLDEASRCFRLTAWQRFWRLEVPFALPGLVWNMMMSMAGGWFFVVAAEAITVGRLRIILPGVGSYLAQAIATRDIPAVGWSIVAMAIAIILCDQLLFRPLVAWADNFRFEQAPVGATPKSWVIDLFRKARFIHLTVKPVRQGLQWIIRSRFSLSSARNQTAVTGVLKRRVTGFAWVMLLISALLYTGWKFFVFSQPELTLSDLGIVLENGGITLIRVIVLISLATLVWVPVGIIIGLRPRLSQQIQPVAQFLAAFPANLFFPIAVFFIVRFHLTPSIWLSPLMILGTQWYILFNVIAGASAFPGDLREAGAMLRVRGWNWWRKIMIPAVLPYYITGAITASGGAWNASIVSEIVNWGPTTLNGSGLGAYIAQMTTAGDYPRIALGIAVMSSFVITMNHLFWRPLYAFAARRTRLG